MTFITKHILKTNLGKIYTASKVYDLVCTFAHCRIPLYNLFGFGLMLNIDLFAAIYLVNLDRSINFDGYLVVAICVGLKLESVKFL